MKPKTKKRTVTIQGAEVRITRRGNVVEVRSDIDVRLVLRGCLHCEEPIVVGEEECPKCHGTP